MVDDGEDTQKSSELADHGLVFMFCPLADSYAQPIGVFASRNSTRGTVLAQLILQAILLLEEAGAKWAQYEALFHQDQLVPGDLRVCPKLTVEHIHPSQTDKMRVKLATQVSSASMAGGLNYYQEQGIPELVDCEGTIHFTMHLNDLFDALNRRYPAEGLTLGCSALLTIKNAITWLDDWQADLEHGNISRELFHTNSTSEGLRFGNCDVLESETPMLSFTKFKAVFRDNEPTQALPIEELRERLDGLISTSEWECDDLIPNDDDQVEVVYCIIYYIAGYLSRRLKKFSNCTTCLSGLSTSQLEAPVASLTISKDRGRLTHPNVHLFALLQAAEGQFRGHRSEHDVYWSTIDFVIEECPLYFPCEEHKTDMISTILYYYIGMRMRQCCKQDSRNMRKESQNKKKQARQCST
ncbi:hypothetical protein HPB47_005370 [Ixodes persulcatus]|uniref:Uncharacterized protein n=1 Tax=Ixodes persulcatus TaxID=34615 RepID=A0AC60PD65_IXOPE|nr:hypothetical protein HPB47_005370 [Ixodes persulcatus]